ncbi:MAG TPA: alpha/beta fold hydrolase [Solirubrobacteraceae bacterium]
MYESHDLPMPHVDGVMHRFVDVAGARFHVAEAGDGPPLVLLHGWPQHWWSWRKVIPALAEHHRVICPDVRGLGWSGGSDGSYRWDALAGDVFALLDALGHERVCLVGHDWGLVTGYRACLARPERIERYVALAGVHLWQGGQPRPIAFWRPWHLWAIALLGGVALTRLNLGERALRAWRHVGEFTDDEAAIYLGALRRPASIEATVRFDREVTFYEVPRTIRDYRSWHLRVPTLHLLGEHDPLTPFVPHSYRPYADDMTLDAIAGSGHFIPEEAPDQLLERLAGFLAGP